MVLEEFYDYKNRFIEDILTSETIVNLIDDEGEFKDNVKDLVYTHVFPYEYVPDTVQNGWTFICCDVDIWKSGKTTYNPVLYVWVFSHRSRLRLDEGGVRPDKICSEICKKLVGSRFYGLGELEISYVKRFAPMTDYQGKVMRFDARDFNNLFDGKRPIPSNRKTG